MSNRSPPSLNYTSSKMDADGGGSGIPFSEGVPGENCLSWSVPFYDWFKDLLFSALLGEMIQFDEYF